MSEVTREPTSALRPGWLWLVVAAGALALRLPFLDARSLWLDEIVSVEVIRAPFVDILLGRVFDNHTPPLYYVLLKLWGLATPEDVLWLRLPSALLDAGNAALLGFVCARVLPGGLRTGAIAGGIYALSPYAIRLAQEARMYPLVVLCAILVWAAATRFVAARRPSALVVAAIVSVAGLYTHYYFAFLLAVLHAWTLFELRRDARAVQLWAAQAAVVALAFLPWLPRVLQLAADGQSFRRYSFAVLPYTLYRFAAGYGTLHLDWRDRDDLVAGALAHLPEILAVLGIAAPLLAAAGWIAWRGRAAGRSLAVLVLGVPLVALAFDALSPSLSERYLAVVFPFAAALVALLPWGRRRPVGWPVAQALGASLLVFSLVSHLLHPDAGTERWRDAAAAIVAAGGPERVLVHPTFYRSVLHWHLPNRPIHGVFGPPECAQGLAAGDDELWQGEPWLVEVEAFGTLTGSLARCGFAVEERGRWEEGNGLRLLRVEPFRGTDGAAAPGAE